MGSPLTRFTQKLFGNSAGADQIAVFGSKFAGAPTFTTNPGTAMSLGNWQEGWYSAAIGGNAPAIQDMNSCMFVLAYQLAYLFQSGVPEWDAGTTYYSGQFCSQDGELFTSQVDDNLNNDPSAGSTNWKMYSTQATGTGMDFWGSSLPAGWVWASGKTIGNATSNATERANADTLSLFTMLWDNYANSILPIYDSAGIASTRGANAAADFAANKALAIIDKRGRTSAGLDNLGGTTASRLTGTTMTPNGTTLGASGGAQTHTLSTAEIPAHTHVQDAHTHTQNSHTHNQIGTNNVATGGSGALNSSGTGTTGVATAATTAVNQNTTATNQSTGGGGAHDNVQPTILCNYILKL